MITSGTRSRHGTVQRVVFLPYWHDNPYQELLADALRTCGVLVEFVSRRLLFLRAVCRRGRPDVVHLHAPDHFVVYRRSLPAAVAALGLFVAQITMLRLYGVRVIWTVHDLTNHERQRPRLDRWCRLLTARLSDALLVHCDAARQQVADAYGVDPRRIGVVAHGHYHSRYSEYHGTIREARAALNLPEDRLIILFLGNLRRHKGLEPLLEAHGRIGRDRTLLVIAGEPFDTAILSEIQALAAGRVDVDLRARHVPDADVPLYLCAADVVVCPFIRSLTSGSLALALSFGKPVVASRLGCAAAMVTEEGGFLYDASQPNALLVALRAAFDARDRLVAIGAANQTRMRQHDWLGIARQTLAIYEDGATG